MKHTQTTPPQTEDSREGLHTHLKIGNVKRASELEGDEYAVNILDEHGHLIAKTIYSPYYDFVEAEANAELIVKAVNERQKLLDSNRELLETLEAITARLNGEWDHPSLIKMGLLSDCDSDIINYATKAINKYYGVKSNSETLF